MKERPEHPTRSGRTTKDLGQTLPASAFGGAPAPTADAVVAPPDPAEPIDFPAAEIWTKLGDLGMAEARAQEPRYRVESMLGVGSTGQVYAVVDRNLERQIAVKVLNRESAAVREELAGFIEEAKITAALKHPNVLPVLDIDVTPGGRPYFCMGKVAGRTLEELIEQSAVDTRHARLDSFNRIVSIFIDICDAVAFAHHQRIVHQDLKPANILVGDFGEVLVLDWGSARRCEGDVLASGIYGTPLYMSPEQARREGVGPLSDIYCIGATLMHALTLRVPTWSDDPDEFWRRKRAGEIDPPTARERSSIPTALLAIAHKALAAAPGERYAAVTDLRSDLERYQSGLAISAQRDTRLQSVRRWYRRHRRGVWTWTCVIAGFVTLGAALYGERLKEIATWGTPIVTESFGDDSWRQRWTVDEGGFRSADGVLVSTGAGASRLVYPQRLAGATAIEYEAMVAADALPGDLTVIWARDLDRLADGHIGFRRPLELKVGAYEGSYTAILSGLSGAKSDTQVAYSSFKPVPGRWYRIRDEIIGNRLTMSIDGERVCEYTDTFPLTGGYVALYAYYPGKAFRDLRIFSLGLPQRVAATTSGDDTFEEGRYEAAAERYRRVALAQRGTALGEEALYKEGLCWFRTGDLVRAEQRWGDLHDAGYVQLARLHRLDDAFAAGRHEQVLEGIAALLAEAAPSIRRRIAVQWASYADRLRVAKDLTGALGSYLALHDRLLRDETTADESAARCLLELGRPRDVLSAYPRQRHLCTEALMALRRPEEIVRDYADQHIPFGIAAVSTGRFDLVRATCGDLEWLIDEADLHQGRFEELLARTSKIDLRCACLLRLGRFAELIELRPRNVSAQRALILSGHPEDVTEESSIPWALLAQERLDELQRRFPASEPACELARLCRGLDAARLGDAATAVPLLGAVPDRLTGDRMAGKPEVLECDDLVIRPFILELLGERDALTSACEVAVSDEHHRFSSAQRPWYSAMLLLGRVTDQQFLTQPCSAQAAGLLALLKGIAAERAGHGDAALASYRSWLDQPPHRRALIVDLFRERFARWRVEALAHR